MSLTPINKIYGTDDTSTGDWQAESQAQATSIEQAFTRRLGGQWHNYVWPTIAERNAQTGMVAGDLGYQSDTGFEYRYSGSVWTPTQVQDTGWVPGIVVDAAMDISANGGYRALSFRRIGNIVRLEGAFRYTYADYGSGTLITAMPATPIAGLSFTPVGGTVVGGALSGNYESANVLINTANQVQFGSITGHQNLPYYVSATWMV